MSFAVLFSDRSETRYAFIGGQVAYLVREAVAGLPEASEVIAGMDADPEGRKLAAVIQSAVALSGRTDLKFTDHVPVGFKDWNDQLRGHPHLSSSYCPLEGHRPNSLSGRAAVFS